MCKCDSGLIADRGPDNDYCEFCEPDFEAMGRDPECISKSRADNLQLNWARQSGPECGDCR